MRSFSKKLLTISGVIFFSIFHVHFSEAKFSLGSSKRDGLQCRLLPPIMQGFMAHHISIRKYDPTLDERIADQFIKRLDPSKVYLLESDVSEIKNNVKNLLSNMASGDCDFILKAHQRLIQRIEENSIQAKKLLSNEKFSFEPNTEIIIDPAKRSYSKTSDEALNQLKKFMQFQISNYLASEMKLPQARKQLMHRYELNVKRNKDMKEDEVYSLFLDSFASSLDAHSSYLSKDVLEDFEISMRLSLEGIGTSLSWDDGYTTVEALIPGGAAERSKEIQPKDKIIAVGQGITGPTEPVIDTPLRDVVKLIRGNKGTFVRLTILRSKGDKTSTFNVKLKREQVNLKEDAAKLSWIEKPLQNNKKLKLAVLELPSFYGDMTQGSRSCYEDMEKLITEATEKKADGLILDLSKNGGGLLGEAVRIGGLFISRGNIVATQDSKNNLDILADDDPSIRFTAPMVVLTSRLSASASEIVAGALQDYKRALIVGGDHTFGKGTVQVVSNLPQDLGAIKVTTGMFFIPGGQSTQHRGVIADVTLPSPFSTKDLGEQALDYSLPPKAISKFVSKEALASEPQNQWTPISTNEIEQLKSSSQGRTSKDKEFQKILTEVQESDKKNGVIRLADALKKQKDGKEKKSKSARRGTKEGETKYLETPVIKETLEILTDLIKLRMASTSGSIAGKN